MFQIASGYEDGNDANALRHDPLFKLVAGRALLDEGTTLGRGAENAMIMKRVFGLLRRYWPHTPILLRGDGHFSHPEMMALIQAVGLSGGGAEKSKKQRRNAKAEHLEVHATARLAPSHDSRQNPAP